MTKELEFTETFGGGTVKAIAETVDCPARKVAMGGGANGVIFAGDVVQGPADLFETFPQTNPNNQASGWAVANGKPGGTGFAVGEGLSATLYATCVLAN